MGMTLRENAMAILNYEKFDYFPVVHFGYWQETLEKWVEEGHIKPDEIVDAYDGSVNNNNISSRLGFDFNWNNCFSVPNFLFPGFEGHIIEKTPDGYIKSLDGNGVIILTKEGITSIPVEVDHLLKDRQGWEEHFKHRLQFSADRIDSNTKAVLEGLKDDSKRQEPLALHLGSLFGNIRNMLGVTGTSYLLADDEDLYIEIIDTVGNLCYEAAKYTLESGARFDYAHFWEDICFKNGPLVIPSIFEEYVGPHYKRITKLCNDHGINIVSLDCDGCIDALVPIWLENGVNTMFPIEVGTWDASIAPWRQQYGRNLRGVGGMNKTVFARDYKAVDEEIERLKRLVELGGYIPCPDHRIAPDAVWENVQYYCEQFRRSFN